MRVISRAWSTGAARRRCRPIIALAAGVLAPAACVDDTPLATAVDATARLAISAQVASATGAASTVGIRVSYLRAAAAAGAAAPQEITLLSREVSVGTGPQQVPVAVDLTRCLADPQRAAPSDGCQLRVVLRLLVGQTVVDSAALTPIAVRPGETATVSEPVALVAVASIAIEPVFTGTSDGPPQPFVRAGRTLRLVATTRDANGNVLTGRAITWTSTNTTTATVSPTDGVVSGRFPGATTISATSGVATGQLQVTVAAEFLTISPPTASVFVGNTVQLTATVFDANRNALGGVPISWSSNAEARARVNANGLVTGVSVGTPGTVAPPPVIITASGGGVSSTASITVLLQPPR